ncbi:MAG TPA: hypothetical protein DCQ06_02370 [Myxococcales bacterium]|nr:hypothetical protein [Myxococcales bacterium]HAN30420.1 hypothetical protein [Myxococcales bacterium]
MGKKVAKESRDRVQLIFFGAIVVLIALSAWWMVFFLRAVNNEYIYAQESLKATSKIHELSMKLSGFDPIEGALSADARFVIRREGPEIGAWRVEPAAEVLSQIEKRHQGRKRMWLGEGALLTGLLLAVVLMLYRLVRAERRFRDEMEDFLSHVTHEMKTPLAGIKAVLQVLSESRIPAEQVAGLTSKALREVDREHQLIQNLLLASRLRLPRAQLMREAVDVCPLLERIIEHRNSMSVAQQRFTLEQPDSAIAMVDVSALQSIVDNLLDNATKYGGDIVNILVSLQGLNVTISVADNGQGFDPSEHDALFAPFQRGVGTGAQGTGLGLHISRALARRMQGDVTAQSSGIGHGARFEVILPLADPSSTQ